VPQHRTDYQAYLLRMRRVDNAGQPLWRFSLESPSSGERRSFASLADVLDFLNAQLMDAEHGHARPHKL
jgi:hypothetical protein